MSEDLTKAQQILMWELFAAGGEKLNKDIVPQPDKKVREALSRCSLIDTRPANRSISIELTDSGWRWISETDPFPIALDERRVTAERRLLQNLMRSIKRYASTSGTPIRDMFRQSGLLRDADRDVRKDERSVGEIVRSAFFEIAGRPARNHVRLSTLRSKLPQISRSDLDSALLAMRKAGTANLMNLDNPRDIEAEGDAVLRNGAQTFHVIWIVE